MFTGSLKVSIVVTLLFVNCVQILCASTQTSAANRCPSSLVCAKGRNLPTAQDSGYLGRNNACTPLAFPPLTLDGEMNVIINFFGVAIPAIRGLKLETPFALRLVYLFDTTMWNVLTAFHATALPTAYKSGLGLPFDTREPGASVQTRNTALLYALTGVAKVILPPAHPGMLQMMEDLGLDIQFTSTTDSSNPAGRIGNVVAAAVLAHAREDFWNSEGTQGSVGPSTYPFSDYTKFTPSNAFDKLERTFLWQPLLETSGSGYFMVQTHVGAQIRSQLIAPFSLTNKTEFYAKYDLPLSMRPWPKKDVTEEDLTAFKEATDEVIDTLANLDDRQKMLAEMFDDKLDSFGLRVLMNYGDQTWFGPGGMHNAVLAFMNSAALYDATLVTWRLKLKFQSIRPVSAIRYLYDDRNITTYAGAYAGTKNFPAKEFNSYLRTMPHTDFPSGTACICVAFAEYMESILGFEKGKLHYTAGFTQGCSFKEPGATPAVDFTETWTDTAAFIADCAQTRLWAGVHFQKAIDGSKNVCSGLGYAGAKRMKALLDGTAN